MKSKFIAAAIIGAGLLTTANASDSSRQLVIGVASEKVDGYSEDGKAIVFNAGRTLGAITSNSSLRMETGFTHSFENAENTISFLGDDFTTKLKIMTLGLYLSYNYNITPSLHIKPRVGVIHRRGTVKISGTDGFSSGPTESRDNGTAYGLQVGYNLFRSMDIVGSYNMIDGSDVKHISLGAQFRF